jgi:hypothetical protein
MLLYSYKPNKNMKSTADITTEGTDFRGSRISAALSRQPASKEQAKEG